MAIFQGCLARRALLRSNLQPLCSLGWTRFHWRGSAPGPSSHSGEATNELVRLQSASCHLGKVATRKRTRLRRHAAFAGERERKRARRKNSRAEAVERELLLTACATSLFARLSSDCTLVPLVSATKTPATLGKQPSLQVQLFHSPAQQSFPLRRGEGETSAARTIDRTERLNIHPGAGCVPAPSFAPLLCRARRSLLGDGAGRRRRRRRGCLRQPWWQSAKTGNKRPATRAQC